MVAPDRYPLPWELLKLDRYLYRGADGAMTLPLITSRGCPDWCGFCCALTMHRCQWRPHSIEYLANAKQEIERQVRPEAVQFFDDNFFADRARAEAVIALWSRPWSAEMRAERVDAEFAA